MLGNLPPGFLGDGGPDEVVQPARESVREKGQGGDALAKEAVRRLELPIGGEEEARHAAQQPGRRDKEEQVIRAVRRGAQVHQGAFCQGVGAKARLPPELVRHVRKGRAGLIHPAVAAEENLAALYAVQDMAARLVKDPVLLRDAKEHAVHFFCPDVMDGDRELLREEPVDSRDRGGLEGCHTGHQRASFPDLRQPAGDVDIQVNREIGIRDIDVRRLSQHHGQYAVCSGKAFLQGIGDPLDLPLHAGKCSRAGQG